MALENTVPVSLARIERLGKNHGRYLGETIDLGATLDEVRHLASKHGWRHDCFLRNEQFCLEGYHLPAATPGKRLYLSAGIHGDEPAGPLAVLELARENRWPATVDIWLCPCLNPTGFPLNTRENARGLDLNRQYLKPTAEETRAHMGWLQQQPAFDVSLCLHEDWEAPGFYVYELNLDQRPSFAEAIIDRVEKVCPIDRSPLIEGREAHGGIIRPNADVMARPQWPEAFYLIVNKTRLSYTLEAPSDFPLRARVAALAEGVRAVTDVLAGPSPSQSDHPGTG
jgi:Succinylglutamate desuccinylase / Aspartoacylase family